MRPPPFGTCRALGIGLLATPWQRLQRPWQQLPPDHPSRAQSQGPERLNPGQPVRPRLAPDCDPGRRGFESRPPPFRPAASTLRRPRPRSSVDRAAGFEPARGGSIPPGAKKWGFAGSPTSFSTSVSRATGRARRDRPRSRGTASVACSGEPIVGPRRNEADERRRHDEDDGDPTEDADAAPVPGCTLAHAAASHIEEVEVVPPAVAQAAAREPPMDCERCQEAASLSSQ